MKPPKRRLFAFFLGIIVSSLTLDIIERQRAVRVPGGWERTEGEPLPAQPRTWNIGSSAWRVAPGTTWISQKPHDQVYVRAELQPPSRFGLTLSTYQQKPLWVWLDAEGNVSVLHAGEPITCMGKISPNPASVALEIRTDSDGLMVTRDNNKMICPRDETDSQQPQLKVADGSINIRSIGRDRQTDGVPLSPLWWMSGLMGLCFIWMALIDTFVGLIRTMRPQKQKVGPSTEE